MEGATPTMMEAVTTGLGTVIEWVGDVLSALTTGSLSGLLPLLAIGIAVSAFFMGVKAIRGVTWGS